MKIKKVTVSTVVEIVIDLLLLTAGILCCCSSSFTARFLSIAVGVALIVSGVLGFGIIYLLKLFSFTKLISSLFLFIFGIIVCCNFTIVNQALIIIFGVICLIMFLNYLGRVIFISNLGYGFKEYWEFLIRSIIYLVIGVLAIIDSSSAFGLISIVLGIGIIYFALTRFVDLYRKQVRHKEDYDYDFSKMKNHRNKKVVEVEETKDSKVDDDNIIDVEVK